MRSSRLLALLAAAFVLGACDDNVTGGGNGRLTVLLTDAPGDLEDAFVKIEKIILLRSGNDSLSTDSTRRIEITPDVTGFIDLTNLTGGQVLELVGAEPVPEGSFSELRVVVSDAYIEISDGRIFATADADLPAGVEADGTLRCPSCSSSGYKVKFSGGGLNIQGNSTVVLDFDASQSFGHEAGKSGQWVMHPVLRATATTIRFANITGNVTLATGITVPVCGGGPNNLSVFKPLAILGADTLTGVTDTLGAFKISNVLPGTYTLGFIKDVTFTNGDSLTIAATPSVATLAIAQGDSAKANFQVTAASCH